MRGIIVGIGAAAAAWASLIATPSQAEVKVAVSIAPAHSLVAQVMEGVGEPTLLVPAGTSPHHFSMKPSQARALEAADVVFWVGPAMEGWMVKPVKGLAKKSKVVALSEADGLTRLKLREGGVWEAHDHGDGHAHKKDGHSHGHKHKKDGHSHGHSHKKDSHGHKHEAGAVDQHFWLDPRNAAAWVEQIVRAMVEKDPANAERYKANAVKALEEIAALEKETAETLQAVQSKPFIVFHDAYHYFEQRFGLQAAGSISLPDAGAPGPARLAEIRDKIADSGAICVFTEPQFQPRLARMATDGTSARIGELDPLGAGVATGAGQYAALIRALAQGLRDCLGEGTTAER